MKRSTLYLGTAALALLLVALGIWSARSDRETTIATADILPAETGLVTKAEGVVREVLAPTAFRLHRSDSSEGESIVVVHRADDVIDGPPRDGQTAIVHGTLAPFDRGAVSEALGSEIDRDLAASLEGEDVLVATTIALSR